VELKRQRERERESLFAVIAIRNTQIHFQAIYNNSVRTSQETHYVSFTMSSLLILFGKQSLFIVRTVRNTQMHFQIIYV
jgi:hypothetical protein